MTRMNILDTSEKELFNNPPPFSRYEQEQFFAVPPGLDRFVLNNLKTPTNKVCFLVMLGYFKATKRFFPGQFHDRDVRFVAERVKVSSSEIDASQYDRATFIRHKKVILKHFGFREFKNSMKPAIHKEAQTLAHCEMKPKLVMTEIFKFLIQRKIEIPSYHFLSTIIIEETHRHKRHLTQIIHEHLTSKQREMLAALLEKEGGDEGNLHYQRRRLTLLKKINQSMRPSKIKANTEDLIVLRDLFYRIEHIINSLDLTNEGIKHYAESVIKSKVFQVFRRDDDDLYLHLVTFISHQYFSMQDALIDTLLLAVQNTLNSASRQHKEQYYEERHHSSDAMSEVIGYLDRNTQAFSAIRRYAAAHDLSAQEKLNRIEAVLEAEEQERKARENRLQRFRHEALSTAQDQDIYSIFEAKSLKLQNRVSEIVKSVEFNTVPSHDKLADAITYFKQRDGVIDKNAPLEFLKPAQQTALFDNKGRLRVSLYKVLLFIRIAEAIKAGALNLRHSYKYRLLDDYLIDHTQWQKKRKKFISQAHLGRFSHPSKVLNKLQPRLDERYQCSNGNIIGERNKLITFTKKGFHLATPKSDNDSTELLSEIFPSRQYISLSEVLSTINRATNFLSAFEHWQATCNRSKPHERTFMAGIIGYGCNIGPRKMARISKHIREREVENTVSWYFSVDNIRNAINRIIQFMDKLDLPNVYCNVIEGLHTSSDGQKYEVAVDSLNANYSYKYFGQERGVSTYSFIDERHMPFYSTVISASEREAAYVIDGLMHNDVIKSDIHSTDTHGYTEIVFAVTYLLGFTFAPRIKNLCSQRIYSFIKKKVYAQQGYKILPDGYINTKLIEDNWDEILRFIATIKLRVSSASQLFRRLNSYSKKYPLYQALKELGKIVKSIFILRYIDNPVFRQQIEKQMNKSESSNKFSKAISFGNNQEFLQGTKEEQDLAESCRRLIENAIICWNYLYLSQKIADEPDASRRAELVDIVRNGSVATWKHFNLHGEYDFSDEKLKDSVGLDIADLLKFKL